MCLCLRPICNWDTSIGSTLYIPAFIDVVAQRCLIPRWQRSTRERRVGLYAAATFVPLIAFDQSQCDEFSLIRCPLIFFFFWFGENRRQSNLTTGALCTHLINTVTEWYHQMLMPETLQSKKQARGLQLLEQSPYPRNKWMDHYLKRSSFLNIWTTAFPLIFSRRNVRVFPFNHMLLSVDIEIKYVKVEVESSFDK